MDTSFPYILAGTLSDTGTDCACPAPPIVAPPNAMPIATNYQRADDLYLVALRDNWFLAANPLAGGPPALLNQAAHDLLATFVTPRTPDSVPERQLVDTQLIVPQHTRYHAPQGPTTELTAWLHVTNACNLDCPFCYVRKSNAHMDLETGQRAIDALITTAQRRGFTSIKLKYAGGEAALHYKMVQQLHAYAVERSSATGISIRGVLLSNGTVIPHALAEWLAASGVRLMLSVDGVGNVHDEQRPRKGGSGGAFALLERNLDQRLLPRGIKPDISITITGRTAHLARDVVRWALDRELPFSLNFYRENEQSARYGDLRLEEQQIIAGMQAAYDVIEAQLPTYPLLNGLLDRVQAQGHGHTCGVGMNYVVITHEGQAAQCQMHLQAGQPFQAESDLITLVAAGPIHNVSVDEKEGCRDCRWRYRCAGGCPIVTLRATGRTDIRSPNCGIYQALLPQTLRLEGLRLLQLHGQTQAI